MFPLSRSARRLTVDFNGIYNSVKRAVTIKMIQEASTDSALAHYKYALCQRRYLSGGEDGNNMTFELIGYTDTLLESLGLSSHRKGWFKDLFQPVTTKDFVGIKEEFQRKYEYLN